MTSSVAVVQAGEGGRRLRSSTPRRRRCRPGRSRRSPSRRPAGARGSAAPGRPSPSAPRPRRGGPRRSGIRREPRPGPLQPPPGFGQNPTKANPAGNRAPVKAVVVPAAQEHNHFPPRRPPPLSSRGSPLSPGVSPPARVSPPSPPSPRGSPAPPWSSPPGHPDGARPTHQPLADPPAGPRPPGRTRRPLPPAPRLAVWFMAAYFLEISDSQEEGQVLRALGEPAHQVAVPLLAVGQVDPDGLAGLASRRCSSGRMP